MEYRGFNIVKEKNLERDVDGKVEKTTKYVATNKYYKVMSKTGQPAFLLFIFGFLGIPIIYPYILNMNELYGFIFFKICLIFMMLGCINVLFWFYLKPSRLESKSVEQLKLKIDYEKDYVFGDKK